MRKIRYAVVGLGDIAQEAVLPAFGNAKSSELVALVSGDREKLDVLGRKYKIDRTYSYDRFEDCLMVGDVDAVYIALPNHLHREYTVRAARKGVHVLCEKPMAPNEEDCRAMIEAARNSQVKLMIAYRLHFDPATLESIDTAVSGELGDLRFFSSTFSQQVRPGNVRVTEDEAHGGGSVWDMGVYCINAARYYFRDEPISVTAFSANSDHQRFEHVDEMTSAVLRFPGERLAVFTSSFGASDSDALILVGTKGRLEIEPAYTYVEPMEHTLTVEGKSSEKKFSRRDQFAAEIDYFSECIAENTEPEPSGEEGLADVRIIDAVYRSAMSGSTVQLSPFHRSYRPSKDQAIKRPAHGKVEPFKAASPGMES